MAALKGQESTTQSYAQALFNVAKGRGTVAELMSQAAELAGVLAEQPKIAYFLESPQVPTEKKHALIDKALKGSLNPVLVNMLRMLVDRDRAGLLSGILTEFEEIAERAEGIYPASVTSARELREDEKQNLQRGLEKYTASRLKIKYHVRRDLLGGIVFRFKDVLVDGSVRHGLNEIRRRFEGS
ncbi:ATP synthase F1 subunit delta [Candidatus Sumerlaeota bacterium]|nr:ATP synthase F1 subunit delta [Candidatus Sumerlaeota bacterium]